MKNRRIIVTAVVSCFFAVILAALTNAVKFPLLFASLASSIILVFSRPESRMSQPKAVVGGHLLAGGIGILTRWVFQESVVFASGVSIFVLVAVMLLTGTFHPPAGGTAWSFILYEQSVDAYVGLFGGTLLLSLVTLGGKDSLVLNFLLYFYGTPFYRDSPIESLNDIEELLEAEFKVIGGHPFLDEQTRSLRMERNEKIRRLMLLVLEDQIKDRQEEEKLIQQVRELDRTLEGRESPSLTKLDVRLDEALEKLGEFIEEFGED
jgi:hypothetical protein